MRTIWITAITLVFSASLFAQSVSPKQNQNPVPAQTGSPSSNPGDSTHLIIKKLKEPVYPIAARQQRIQGQVWVHLVINETGDVLTAEAVSGDPLLVSAAMDAMKQWKFEPYIQNGHPVRVSTKMHYDFAFSDMVHDKPAAPDTASGSSAKDASDTDAGNPGNPPTPNPGQPKQVRVSQGVSQGLLVHQVAPFYPANARSNRVQGTVVLQATIGKDGRIQNLTPVSAPSKELTEAAIGAVEQWRYKPYTLKGEPVEVLTTINVNFVLR
jgi:TonB family protein